MHMNLCCKFRIGLVVLMSLGSGICQQKIEAGPVLHTGNTIQGSFKIVSATAADGGIQSNRLGGACMVVDLNKFGIPKMPTPARSCSKSSDCQNFDAAKGEGTFHGYCDIEKHQCWVRPGDNEVCNRSKDFTPPKPWDLNVSYPSNQSFSLVQKRYSVSSGSGTSLKSFMQLYGPSRWRVVACLNGVNAVNGVPFCAASVVPDSLPPNTGMDKFGTPSAKLP